MADKDQISRGIALASIGFGMVGLVAPARLGGSYGLDDTPQMRLMGRLFSSRNLALGAIALAADNDGTRDRVLLAATAMNLADTGAAVVGGVHEGMSKRATAMVALTTLGFAAAGVLALTRE